MAEFVIQCTFNRGFSAAEFLFAPNEDAAPKTPPPLIEELGGVWGGGTILACMPPLPRLKKGCIEAPMGVFRQQKAIERLEDRLRTVEDLCAEQHREAKKLDLEFTDLYDKVRRQMSRMAKRYAVDAKEENGEILPDSGNSHSDTLDPISRSIMLRRARQAGAP